MATYIISFLVATNDAAKLKKVIIAKAREGKFDNWEWDGEHLYQTSDQLETEGKFEIQIQNKDQNEYLKFNLIFLKQKYSTINIGSLYMGRLVTMLLSHFQEYFESITIYYYKKGELIL
jgi:uncharacterized radical SAM superfamily Fe-S cluster-containing enzyme